MGKTEILLTIIILCLITFGLWFVLSGEIWVLVAYFENSLYPTIETP